MNVTDQIPRQALKKAFPDIPDLEVDRILEMGTVADYKAGTVLCLEDRVEQMFYVLLDGQVKVTKVINEYEDRFLKHLSPGDFFGEMGIIHNAPRAATVTTTTDSAVLEVGKDAFELVLQASPSVSVAMVREVSRRLRENDEMAIEDLRLKAGELASAYQQLAELDMARREFLTTIAHELRTPLTSASGFMQVIRMGMMEGEALKSALDTVNRNLDRVVSLTNDILFLQEMDLILSEFEPVEIGALITGIVDAERSHAEKMGVGFKINLAPNLTSVPGDVKSLERAFSAILNNAIKFSLNGGEVQVTADHNPTYVWVRIRDEGIGIPEGEFENIYERFWRTEGHDGILFGGVGLGLPIAKQVIEQHGGQIDVQSKAGEGSTFTIRLKLNVEVGS
ncbi:sensor histidine kinase [Chloroflexota bacterium]